MSPDGDTGLGPEPRSRLEEQVQAAARGFDYPETPDIARGLKRRWAGRPARRPGLPRLVWAAAILLAVIAGLLAVPRVRASVLDWIRLGAVRIFLVAPTPVPTPAPPAAAGPTPVVIASLLDLAGETSLEQARKRVGIDLRLPDVPSRPGPTRPRLSPGPGRAGSHPGLGGQSPAGPGAAEPVRPASGDLRDQQDAAEGRRGNPGQRRPRAVDGRPAFPPAAKWGYGHPQPGQRQHADLGRKWDNLPDGNGPEPGGSHPHRRIMK